MSPKKHSHNLFDIEDAELCAVIKTTKKLAVAIKSALSADGINIEMNNDPAAGQLIFHAHLHIVPRFQNDGFKHWPGTASTESERKSIAKKIKEQLT